MSLRTGNFLNVITAGFIVLALTSLVLFSGRFLCFEVLMEGMPLEWQKVTICPSGLLPGEGLPNQTKVILTYADAGLSNDPNTRLSSVQFELDSHFVRAEPMGIKRKDMKNLSFGQFHSKEGFYYYHYGPDNYLLFNKHSGLLVYAHSNVIKGADGKNTLKLSVNFAGPNGVSETASASLGRFEGPIVDMATFYTERLWLYEVKQRRFYFIDYRDNKVTAGPEGVLGDKREPVSIGRRDYLIGPGWTPPASKDANGEWKLQYPRLLETDEPNERWMGWSDYTKRYLTVLDKSGQIYKVNTVDWSLRYVGYLPAPRSLYSDDQQNWVAAPKDLLNYQINPVYYTLIKIKGNRMPEIKDVKYFGMCTSSVSREGTAMAVAVFDPNGKLIYRGDTKADDGTFTASAVYSKSPLAKTILFLLENLQPPVFGVASYLYGNCIEASAGHRGLFILPNSFVGMLGRYNGKKFDREVFFPLLIGPSLILSGWLAFRVRKDAKIIGLSGTAIKWWTIGTFAFGLPAYITYRLTRPKETLVTCKNCGNMRRPDMETCHRCGSKWEMPELVAPMWRIKD